MIHIAKTFLFILTLWVLNTTGSHRNLLFYCNLVSESSTCQRRQHKYLESNAFCCYSII